MKLDMITVIFIGLYMRNSDGKHE